MNFLQRFFLKHLVASKTVPSCPQTDLQIDVDKPIVYALKTLSSSDLLTLQRTCQKLNLPDPLTPLAINQQNINRYVCLNKPKRLFSKTPRKAYEDQFKILLDLHQNNDDIDVQLVPVTLFWGRAPGYEGHKPWFSILRASSPNWINKAFTILFRGRDSLIRFSKPLSLQRLYRDYGDDPNLATKLEKIAYTHFTRQKLAAKGPKLPQRNKMRQDLLASDVIHQAIVKASQEQNISLAEAEKKATRYLDEIASDFSYPLVRLGDKVLTWVWNRIYQGIMVNNAETVRNLAHKGYEIVFLPCHRSHMDYLLLSSIIYQQGMTPPHIAAGVNLNFFPAGPIFRRGGAFFIRRTFKGNPLYASVFKAYLSYLFSKGYSLEFFTEGGRSRTGRLLPAKTGMLGMTIEAMQNTPNRPIALIPVCLGYDHVMEVSTYMKELQGQKKQKESFWQVLSITNKLRNFGQGFVNFGEPILLNQFLDRAHQDWRGENNLTESALFPATINQLGREVMTGINRAAAVNALPLCSLVLLASKRHTLSREQLLTQLTSYLSLLNNVEFSPLVSLPQGNAESVLQAALSMDKFRVYQDCLGEIISIEPDQSMLLTFYRNNIIHLFALPALIASLVQHDEGTTLEQLESDLKQLYPLIKAELFLPWDADEMWQQGQKYLAHLVQQGWLECEMNANTERYFSVNQHKTQIRLLANIIDETIQRYHIVLTLLQRDQPVELKTLAQQSTQIAERLAQLHGIRAPEFFDVKVLQIFIEQLQSQQYIDHQDQVNKPALHQLHQLTRNLLSDEVLSTIEDTIANQDQTDPCH
ncbi:glycerol-3-phosphate 1-O-acyltransferase PlsB [Motilimonas sp. 1_MG-2023]|uniref:glycerol-3-phosphate 1-O-acyltransferase PlsB n=1 Tax=Motilimonas sp. 1_MG-2023 TaxID=3062672 RepID=UPI0026E1A4A5|nr:glycerol-3-phosphate 1-O-acyltransferase PlsB [Motilimonas sp. 1_MG-2023]MDO6524770.1 glycerol-3-phosphate 1-O-acyltransferase PlsB [Motilimonas sp. 1_MG-2023]